MDLVSALTSQLGVGETEAKGLAGGLIGLVQKGLEQQAGPQAAAELQAQVPEMEKWQQEGDTPEGEPGIGDLLGSLGGSLGGMGGALGGLGNMLGGASETAGLVTAISGMIEKFGLDSGKASIAGGLVANFLQEKLGGDLLKQVQPILAMLSGGGGGGAAGGLGGMLGGLFK